MDSLPLNKPLYRKSPFTFFMLVFLMSSIFWSLGAATEGALPEETAIDLPISSLMGICPMLAAMILVHREDGLGGVKELFKRFFDYKTVKRKTWYIPIFFLMPGVMIVVNVLLGGNQTVIPEPQVPIFMTLISCGLFFIESITEEAGWQGYAFDPLQERWNALTASIILGFVWAIWHIIPFIQMNQPVGWIVWQSINILVTRIIIAWLYNNTGKSLFAAILYHSMYNVSTILLTSFGLIYNPMITTIILITIVLMVVFLWGPRTLARYRFAKPNRLGKISFTYINLE